MSVPRNCSECWAVPAQLRVDAGMFGEKDVCETCYRTYFSPRPIITRRLEDAHE